MRIVYVLANDRGGLPHYAAQLSESVSKYAEVTVLKPEKTTADCIFPKNVEVINAFKPLNISFVNIYKHPMRVFIYSNLRKLISYGNIDTVDRINPNIVHFISCPFQLLLFIHKIQKNYKTIGTLHDVPTRMLPWDFIEFILTPIAVSQYIIKRIFEIDSNFTKIIVHTKANKETLVRRRIKPQKIAIIPHGVYNFFKDKYSTNKEEEKNTILFFGNIVPVKAIDALIDAIPKIKSEIPDIKLTIAGDGKIPEQSWKIIKRHKPNFEIHNYFIPNEKVGEFFSRASLVVIPNRSQEGHSGSLTVAYSFGKTVVTTNVGEFPILVRDAGCGLIVPPDNPEVLAEAIIKLLKDDKLRKEMSKNALKKAEELSWDNIAKMHMNVYEEILNERTKGN
ncbi:MAG: glycosyltransferase family 4 protein [bacterium]